MFGRMSKAFVGDVSVAERLRHARSRDRIVEVVLLDGSVIDTAGVAHVDDRNGTVTFSASHVSGLPTQTIALDLISSVAVSRIRHRKAVQSPSG